MTAHPRIGMTAVPLAAAFAVGFAAETASLYEFWPSVLVLGALVLLVTVALAVGLGERVRLPTAVVAGVVAGCLTAIVFVLGASSPFALELGGRNLYELGGDSPWELTLTIGLIFWGAAGAVVGAACGIAVWALRLGHRRLGHNQGD